ncbi:MAG: hypothetical protein JO035_01405, partial [Betaproteobacteria bacterium]|nr:hypothetical protein [Betaproteobacteria bacterium]
RPILVYRRTAAEERLLARDKPKADAEKLRRAAMAVYGSSASLVWARLVQVDQPALELKRGRSYRPEFLVVAGWGPRSGCRLEAREAKRAVGAVFVDSCAGDAFDAAGRVLRSAAGTHARKGEAFDLYIPPYRFLADGRLSIGVEDAASIPPLGLTHAALYREGDATYNLVIAARYGDRPMLDTALAAGADVNGFREGEGAPLDAAILGSPLDAVSLLLERGARPTARSIRAADFVGRKDVRELLERVASGQRTR